MDRDDIIRMAREAGFKPDMFGIGIWDSAEFNRFAAIVAAEIMPKEALAEMFEWGKDAGRREEREACAKLCDEIYFANYPDAEEWERSEESEAIRARGQG